MVDWYLTFDGIFHYKPSISSIYIDGVGIPPTRLLFNLASTINWLILLMFPQNPDTPRARFLGKRCARRFFMYWCRLLEARAWRLVGVHHGSPWIFTFGQYKNH